MNPLEALHRNQAAAALFVTQLSKLDRQWYGQLAKQIGDVESEPYASTRFAVGQRWDLLSGDARTQAHAFVETSNVIIADANLPPSVDVLAQAVVSAILVRNLEGGERALMTLYQPLKGFLPLA